MLFKNLNKEKPVYDGVETGIPNSILLKETETLVVGGGLLGLSTALTLAEAGRDVTLVEMNKIGDGPSGRSGGQLWPGYEMFLSEMKEKFGQELTLKAWKLTDNALLEVHRRFNKREDRCDFIAGLMVTSKTESQAAWLEKEAQDFKDFGLGFASYVEGEDLKKNYINTDRYLNGIFFLGEEGRQYGHINPLKYTQTTALLAHEAGAKLIENTAVEKIFQMKDARYLVTTSHGEVVTKNIVLATGADFWRPKGIDYRIIPRGNIPAQTVILATEPIPEKLALEMIPGKVCFADCDDRDMNYAALIPDSDRAGHYRLTFGGADALMQAETISEIPKIEKEMRTMFPQLDREQIKVEKIWGGNCDMSSTLLPSILNPRPGIFHADGFSGQGMVNTTLYGAAIAEKILGKDTGKFEILEKLNPPPYSKNILIALLQVVRVFFFKSA